MQYFLLNNFLLMVICFSLCSYMMLLLTHMSLVLLMLLLSYRTCLSVVLDALDLYVDGGRVSHRRCMCVHGHGFDGGRDGGGGWYACGTKPGGLVSCREMAKHFPSAR